MISLKLFSTGQSISQLDPVRPQSSWGLARVIRAKKDTHSFLHQPQSWGLAFRTPGAGGQRTVLLIQGDVEDAEAHWCLSFRKWQMQPPIVPEMVKGVAIGSQEGGCRGRPI